MISFLLTGALQSSRDSVVQRTTLANGFESIVAQNTRCRWRPRAELYLDGFRRGDEFVKRMRSVSATDVQNAANLSMAKLWYAYLGDTTRMRGHW